MLTYPPPLPVQVIEKFNRDYIKEFKHNQKEIFHPVDNQHVKKVPVAAVDAKATD